MMNRTQPLNPTPGQCADTFESIAAEMMAAMILGGALAEEAKMAPSVGVGFVVFPLAVHSMDLIISSVGIMLVRTKKGMPGGSGENGGSGSYAMSNIEDAMGIMKR
jgi:H+-translocating diphosphatase